MRKFAFIVVFLMAFAGLYAQTHTHVYDPNIRTLLVERDVLRLGEEDQLHISFDEMSHDVHFYSYTVDMQESQLTSGEYLRVFTRGDITDYEHSINTSREYTHYWFDFPNEDMQLTKSGLYKLTIFEDANPEGGVVAEVEFCVVEPMVMIDAKVRANTDIEFNGRYQQVDVDVNTAALDIRDPHEVTIVVTQNNRTDNAVKMNVPTFVEPNRLRYINKKALIFEGGNEYHHFDAFSCFYAGHGIDRVFHENGDYQVLLFPNEITQGQYIHEYDSNGRYIVNAERTTDPDTEAEYMWVHWALPAEKPWMDGELFVCGDIFNNDMAFRNKMQYDFDTKCYWLSALVKQGGYDYQFWFQESYKTNKGLTKFKTTTQRVDGSYWQTGNEYAIYVFWRPFGARYDRLVGFSIIRSNAL